MGNIIQLKQSDQTKAYPKTVAEAVYMADGTSVEEEIKNIQESAYVEETKSGSIITIDNAAENVPLDPFKATIEPYQDLHGYDSPWPAGGGKNLVEDVLQNSTIYGDGSVSSTSEYDLAIASVQNGTTYAISDNTSPANSAVYAFYSSKPTVGASSYDGARVVINQITFTSPIDGYIAFRIPHGFAYPQLEKGSTATSYAPYSNICPITGKTGITVHRTGKNLIKVSESSYANSQQSTSEITNSGITLNATGQYARRLDVFHVKTGETYTLSFTGYSTGDYKKVYFNNAENWQSSYGIKTITETLAAYSYTFIATTDIFAIGFYITTETTTGTMTITDLQLELGSTATDYEPYTGNSYPISWETEAGTVYGGELDVVSGKLTVDMAIVDLSSVTKAFNTAFGCWVINKNAMPLAKDAETNAEPVNAVASNMIVVKASGYTSSHASGTFAHNASGQWLIDNGSDTELTGQLVYELATPITHTLTPTEVKTLLGKNVIWSDANLLEAEFAADINTVVSGLRTDLEATESELEAAQEEIENLKDSAYVTNTASGDIAAFSDGAATDVKALTVNVEPIQNLNGYDSPWPAGGGVNMLPNGNAFDTTINGIRMTSDGNGKYTMSGTSTANTGYDFPIPEVTFQSDDIYIHLMNNQQSSQIAFAFKYGTTQLHSVTFNALNRVTSVTDNLGGKTVNTLRLYVTEGQTINVTITPMILRTSAVTAYYPYSNICPISGRTGATVWRTGKNLANFIDGYGVDTNGIVVPNAYMTSTIDPIYIKQGASYVYTSETNVAAIYAVWNGNNLVRRQASAPSGSTLNTTGGDRFYITAYGGSSAYITAADNKPMVRLSALPAGYEPYTGSTIPVSWETEAGTVYGGELDVVSGVLTVDKVLLTKNTSTMNNSENYPGWIGAGIRGVIGTGFVKLLNGIMNVGVRFGVNTRDSNDIIYLPVNDYGGKTQSEWIAMAIDVQIVLPLATPQTYQLTPQQIQTLLGDNVVWSDAGSVSVDYRADTKKYVESKIAAQKNIVAGVETSYTATKNYSVGALLIVGETLYKVTSNIASGATITPGTNVTATTVAEQLLLLASA